MQHSPQNAELAGRISELCQLIPDWPEPGVTFRDLTPAFADARLFTDMVDELLAPFNFDAVAGIEARGFILAAAAAYARQVGMLTIRKPGKLPRQTYQASYTLEYGSNTLEIHTDDFAPGTRVLLLDDVLATGGTVSAALDLLEQAGATTVGIGVVLELDDLRGREKLGNYAVNSLMHV